VEETASTNIFFYHLSQPEDDISSFCTRSFLVREKCVLLGVILRAGRKAGKMRKVTAQALLSLVVWSK
jgi:hypothetical protein